MHRATSSSSSDAPSSSSSRSRQRISREQLEKSLKVLGTPSDPLPLDLPLSPPASRSSSPAPSSKRKHDYESEPSTSKRPRTSSVSEPRRQPASSSSHRAGRASHLRSDPPSEDGEVREDLSAPRDTVVLSNVPVRRPRRGAIKALALTGHFNALYEHYYGSARALKYSGTARIYANNRPSSTQYRPLPNPPPPHSSYHKYANVMARLELLESLLHFAYAFWAKDIDRKTYDRGTWRTMDLFLGMCRTRWEQDATDDREKALVGLIHLLDGFMQGGRVRENVNSIHQHSVAQLQDMASRERERRALLRAVPPDHRTSSLPTPPMLPSPASTSGSANSTPAGKRADEEEAQPAAQAAPPPPREMLLNQEPQVKIEMNWTDVRVRKSLAEAVLHGWACMRSSLDALSLPILAKHYPRTFARVIHTTLGYNDEHEPDIEDEDGELYWPSQLLVGGVGWVCALGKAMIKEYGKEFGYKGIDGIVHKSDGDAAFPNQVPDPICAPLPGP